MSTLRTMFGSERLKREWQKVVREWSRPASRRRSRRWRNGLTVDVLECRVVPAGLLGDAFNLLTSGETLPAAVAQPIADLAPAIAPVVSFARPLLASTVNSLPYVPTLLQQLNNAPSTGEYPLLGLLTSLEQPGLNNPIDGSPVFSGGSNDGQSGVFGGPASPSVNFGVGDSPSSANQTSPPRQAVRLSFAGVATGMAGISLLGPSGFYGSAGNPVVDRRGGGGRSAFDGDNLRTGGGMVADEEFSVAPAGAEVDVVNAAGTGDGDTVERAVPLKNSTNRISPKVDIKAETDVKAQGEAEVKPAVEDKPADVAGWNAPDPLVLLLAAGSFAAGFLYRHRGITADVDPQSTDAFFRSPAWLSKLLFGR